MYHTYAFFYDTMPAALIVLISVNNVLSSSYLWRMELERICRFHALFDSSNPFCFFLPHPLILLYEFSCIPVVLYLRTIQRYMLCLYIVPACFVYLYAIHISIYSCCSGSCICMASYSPCIPVYDYTCYAPSLLFCLVPSLLCYIMPA